VGEDGEDFAGASLVNTEILPIRFPLKRIVEMAQIGDCCVWGGGSRCPEAKGGQAAGITLRCGFLGVRGAREKTQPELLRSAGMNPSNLLQSTDARPKCRLPDLGTENRKMTWLTSVR